MIRIAIDGAKPMMIPPIVNKISATMIVNLRPLVSDMGPAMREPKAAPNWAKDTMVYRE